MTPLDAALVFAGIPLLVIGGVFALVFMTTPKPVVSEESKRPRKR